MEIKNEKIPKRILGTLLSSLSAGVVPRVGAPYIAIGRTAEIEALTDDMNRVEGGEGVTRFIIGRYGSGKSFLIQLMRGYAHDHNFITADCDLSPERRLYGEGGLATYRELVGNLSCRTSPDGGALPVIIGKWYRDATEELAEQGVVQSSPDFPEKLSSYIISDARKFEDNVGGFDFAVVVGEYCRAWGEGNDEKMSACLKWLRGEYTTKTEARNRIGIKSIGIIDDRNWYDHMKLLSALARHVGYAGLCMFIDEGVNLYKISNRISREANYEKILSIYNDTLQGRAPGMMVVFGGTPQFLEDTRRGLFSYEALRSRLVDGRIAATLADSDAPLITLMGPLIRLKRLSDNEILALMMRVTHLHGMYHDWEPGITDEETVDFLEGSLARAGAEEMITPREVVRDYIALLDVLWKNPGTGYEDIKKLTFPDKKEKEKEEKNEDGKDGTSGNPGMFDLEI